jgi:hypothetical protein
MDAFKRWAIPIVLVLAWLLTAGYTLASLSRASAAWRARTAPVPIEAQAKPAFSQADLAPVHFAGFLCSCSATAL